MWAGKETIHAELRNLLIQEYSAGYDDALAFFIEKCMFTPRGRANSLLDKDQLPERTSRFLDRMLSGDWSVRTFSTWKPPAFQDAAAHCEELRRKEENQINIGRFQGNAVTVLLCLFVKCSGGEKRDLYGNGYPILRHGAQVTEEIKTVVLGSIAGTGTALLLDEFGEVWLYRTPNAVDPHFPGLNFAACKLVRNGQEMNADQDIEITEKYSEAIFKKEDGAGDEESESSEFEW